MHDIEVAKRYAITDRMLTEVRAALRLLGEFPKRQKSVFISPRAAKVMREDLEDYRDLLVTAQASLAVAQSHLEGLFIDEETVVTDGKYRKPCLVTCQRKQVQEGSEFIITERWDANARDVIVVEQYVDSVVASDEDSALSVVVPEPRIVAEKRRQRAHYLAGSKGCLHLNPVNADEQTIDESVGNHDSSSLVGGE